MTVHANRAGSAADVTFGAGVAVFMGVALVAGGSSASAMSALVVQLASLPIGAWAIWRLAGHGLPRGSTWPLAMIAGAILLILCQLTPLPPHVWTALPGRATLAEVYRVTGMVTPWRAAGLNPAGAWDGALGVIAPTAMFCATLTLDLGMRRWVAAIVPLLALASLVLGIVQVAGGEASPLRFYQVTNADSAVGFFANRNHQATLLVAAIPFAALLGARFMEDRGARRFFWIALATAGALVLCVGLAATRSRAGVLLALPAAVGEAGILMLCPPEGGERGRGIAPALGNDEDRRGRVAPALASVAALALGAVLVVAFNFSTISSRFEVPMRNELRLEVAPSLVGLAHRFDPIGSGVGSFEAVYGMVERPEGMLPAYLNHAHDDYLEVWIECGWPGLGLMGLFGLWWGVRTLRLARRPERPGASLALTGCLVVGLFLVHSLVDYPLRTPGLATLFAFACGLIVLPRGGNSVDNS